MPTPTQLQHLFDHTLDLLCVLSIDACLLEINPAGAAMLGRAQEEVQGRFLYDMVVRDDREAIFMAFARLAAGADVLHFQARFVRPDGHYVDLHFRGRREQNEIYAVAHETGKLQLDSLDHPIPIQPVEDFVFFLNMDGSLRFIDFGDLDRLGLSQDEIERNPSQWREAVHPDDVAATEHFFRTFPDGVTAHDQTYRVHFPDGTTHHLKVYMVGIKDSGGRYIGYNCLGQDITPSIQTQAALRASERRYRSLIENSLDAIFLLDEGGCVIEWNHAAEAITGLSREAVLGRPFWEVNIEVLPPDQRTPARLEVLRERVLGAVTTGRVPWNEDAWDSEIQHIDGTRRIVETRAFPIKTERGYLVSNISRDVTEARQAETERRQLSRAVEQSTNAILLVDSDGFIEWVNPHFTHVSGYAAEEAIGKRANRLFGTISDEETEAILDEVRAGGEWRGEFHNVRKDGRIWWARATMSPIRDSNGVVTHFLEVSEDITEQKLTEVALVQQEIQHQLLLNSIQSPVLALDRSLNIVYCNDAYADFVGRAPGHLEGRPLLEVFPRFVNSPSYELYQLALRTGKKQEAEYEGHGRFLAVRVYPTPGGLLVLVEDITEHKVAERTRERYAARLEIARDISQAILAARTPDSVAEETLKHLAAVVPFDAGSIRVFDFERQQAVTLACVGNRKKTGPLVADMRDQSISLEMKQFLLSNDGSSSITIPLKSHRRIFGVLSLSCADEAGFSAEQIDIAHEVARSLSVAIHNSQLLVAEQDQREFADALRRTSSALTRKLDQQEVMNAILTEVGEVVPHDAANIMLIDDENLVRITYWRGYPEEFEDTLGTFSIELEMVPNLRLMVETGDSNLIPDTATEPDWSILPTNEADLHRWVGSYVATPLIIKGRVIGFLNLDSRTPDFFTPAHAERLRAFANQAALAIENAQLFERERDEHRFNEALRKISAAISTSLDPKVVMQRILEYVGEVVPHDAANIMLVEDGVAFVAYWHGYPDHVPIGEFRMKVEHVPNLLHMMMAREARISANTVTDDRWVRTPQLREREPYPHAYLGVPILVRDEVIGFLNLSSDTLGFFNEHHAERLQAFATQAGIAIQNARYYEEIQFRAATLEASVRERTRQLQHAKEHVESILNDSSDGIILTYPNGTIRQTNPAFDRMFGYDIDETFHWSVMTLVKVNQREMLARALQQALSKQRAQRTEVVAQRKDGSTFIADMMISPIVSDRLSGITISIRDMTRRKQIEEELRKALEAERELSELRARFVSMVSHEFRTPLATIQATADMLNNYLDRMNPDDRDRRFRKIFGQIKHMTSLLEDVLVLGRLESGTVELQPQSINFDTFCREIIDEYRSSDHVLDYRLEGEPTQVEVDPKLMRGVISNLISNAIKYSPEGSTVHIEARCSGEVISLSVRDEGIGIPRAELDRIFEAFHRAKNVGARQGTGLGLAITKQYIDLHGGTIAVASELGAGTTFTVQVPRSHPLHQPSAAQRETVP